MGIRALRFGHMSANATNTTAWPDEGDEILWMEIAVCVCCITALVNGVLLCMSSNLLTWSKESEAFCRPQCGLTVFPKVGVLIVRALRAAGDRRSRFRLIGKALSTAFWLRHVPLAVFSSLYAPRPSFARTLSDVFVEIKAPLRASADAAVAEEGPESEAALRKVDLADTVESALDSAHLAATVYIQSTPGKINISEVTTRAIIAALHVPRAGATAGLQVEYALAAALEQTVPGSVAFAVSSGTNLRGLVAAVYGRVLPRLTDLEPGLERLLKRLINTLVDERALRPIHTLWLRATLVSAACIALLWGGWSTFLWAIEDSRAVRIRLHMPRCVRADHANHGLRPEGREKLTVITVMPKPCHAGRACSDACSDACKAVSCWPCVCSDAARGRCRDIFHPRYFMMSCPLHVSYAARLQADRLNDFAAKYDRTFGFLMISLTAVAVCAQSYVVSRFLEWRSSVLATELIRAIEAALLAMPGDEEVCGTPLLATLA